MNAKTILLAVLLVAAPISLGASAAVQRTETAKEKRDKPSKEKRDKPAPKEGADKKDCDAELTPEERWERMSEEERKVLSERFEALRKLSPEDREALKKRAAELAKKRSDYETNLDPKLRKELEGLPPHERTRILRDHQIDQHRRAGEEIRASLDEGPRHLVEDMFGRREGPPRPFHSMRDELRDEFGDKVVKRYGELGHLSPEEERALLKLSGPERLVQALQIKRKRIEEMVPKLGLPEGTSEKKWEKMQAEPSVEKFLKQCRKAGFDEHLGMGFHGGDKPGGKTRGKPGEHPPGFDRPDGPGRSGPPRNEKERERGDKGKTVSKDDLEIRELGDLLRPSLEDRLSLKDLPFAERRVKMDGLLRERAEAFLKDCKWLPVEDATRIKKLPDGEFIEHLKRFVHEHRGLDGRSAHRGEEDKGKRDRGGSKRGGPPGDGPRRQPPGGERPR